jgi:hypothetical protein
MESPLLAPVPLNVYSTFPAAAADCSVTGPPDLEAVWAETLIAMSMATAKANILCLRCIEKSSCSVLHDCALASSANSDFWLWNLL